LATLSRRQREVIVLRFLADLPEADVARALGCSVGSVKQHSSRGLANLRNSLGTTSDAVATDDAR
jgi:RNA polymerase sigma factor (sigma-70 family)